MNTLYHEFESTNIKSKGNNRRWSINKIDYLKTLGKKFKHNTLPNKNLRCLNCFLQPKIELQNLRTLFSRDFIILIDKLHEHVHK